MDNLTDNKHPFVRQEGDKKKIILPGYPTYPVSEDIYNQEKEEEEIDPEQVTIDKENNVVNENNFKDFSGSDLDVPGSEQDDAQEEIGSEDEENNLYSLGGDNHDN